MTGISSIVYSDSHPLISRRRFQLLMEQVWPKFIIDDQKDEEATFFELIFSKDENMLSYFEEYAFTSNEQGESSIFLIARRADLIDCQIKILQDFDSSDQNAFEPYTRRLLLREVWAYNLITPGSIEKHPFSKRIYNLLIESLRLGNAGISPSATAH
ncbi:MAG: hypothetical protein H6581_14785 [Bacteroidia bacterium]|nr:hypothetical protein [Bacteroidia bacterium]